MTDVVEELDAVVGLARHLRYDVVGDERMLIELAARVESGHVMDGFVVEAAGPDAEEALKDLRRHLVEALGEGSVGPVEVEKSVELLAILSVVLSGVQAATALLSWWQSRRSTSVQIRVTAPDGTVVDLSTADTVDLEIALRGGVGDT